MAFKFALKCPSLSLCLQKISRGRPPDPQLWHGKPSRTLHIHHGAACYIIFYHLVQNKNFLVKRKKLKNTNLWLKPCIDVINPDHMEYLCIFRHIFMAKSGDLKTFFNLFSAKMSLFKNLFFFETHREACNVHRANMGPTWVLSAPDGPHVGPMHHAIRVWIEWIS